MVCLFPRSSGTSLTASFATRQELWYFPYCFICHQTGALVLPLLLHLPPDRSSGTSLTASFATRQELWYFPYCFICHQTGALVLPLLLHLPPDRSSGTSLTASFATRQELWYFPYCFICHQTGALELAARFAGRRLRLKEACRRLNISSEYLGMRHADQRFIFPTNSTPIVLYCPIPKTGTTFLKKTFAVANQVHQVRWIDRFYVRPVGDYDKAVMFFFTREPYSRILSSYVDKLWAPNLSFWRSFGRELVSRLRPRDSQQTSVECGHDVTFPEFVRYFLDGMTNNVHINTHLVPTHKFCETCKYDYDYIGNLETFREDAAYILSVINVTSLHNIVNDDDIVKEHVSQVFYTDFFDRQKCEKKHNLLLRAWRALQIRGLISMTMAFPFTEHMSRFLGKAVFNKTVYEAVRKSAELIENLDSFSESSSSVEPRDTIPGQSAFSVTARAIQKRMALASAYSLVPMADRLKMMELMREEFELFGYAAKPKDVFAPTLPLNPKIFDLANI
ncbi:hypothetical protein ACOMHN_039114 [Nucella lapillus]